jgi:ribokinase
MPRVVVIGSSNTDMTVRLPRLPVPGQTVLGSTFSTTPGGKGANQAVAARRAGAEVAFVTAIGDDDLGRRSLETYKREGIDISSIRVVDGVASGVALIFVAEDGENMIGVASGANLRLTADDIDQLPDSLFRKGDVALVSLEIPLETAGHALRRCFDAGMHTILNPAPAPNSVTGPELRELLAAVEFLTPNRNEALALSGLVEEPRVEPDWPNCGLRLASMGPAVVIITLGSRGCQVVAGKPWPIVAAPPVEVVDTVGAGDAFNGALAAALADGRDIKQAIAWANAAAALTVTRPGAQAAMPFRDSIDQLAARHPNTH